jgi:hypothetical protein
MKKLLLTILCAVALLPVANAQLQYAQNYFRITVQDGTNYVWDHSTENSNINFYSTFHGGKNQQWAIMPLYIMRKGGVLETNPSKEFIISTRYSGRVLDVSGTSDAQVYWPFHGGNNQLYKLDATGTTNVFTISSPLDVNRVMQRYPLFLDVVFFPISAPPTSRQKMIVTSTSPMPYYFTTLTNKRINAIPFPAAPTSFTQTMPTETPKTFIEEMLVPYPLIKNELAYSLQIESSPFYKLVHKQYYRRAAGNWDVVYLKNGVYTHTVQLKTGTIQTKVDEITNKLDLSFSSTGEVTFKNLSIGAKLANTIGAGFSKTVRQLTSWTESYEKTETVTSTMTTLALDRRVVTYQLVDYYELYRANNQVTPALAWEVGLDEGASVIFEGESSGRLREPNARVEPFIIVDGKMVPMADKPVKGVENILMPDTAPKRISVYPNPSKDVYEVQSKPAYYKSFKMIVYNEKGQIVMEEHKANTYVDKTTLSLNSLPAGRYILKVITDDETSTVRLMKE